MSLILRNSLDRKITSTELDQNFTYLESISGGSTASGATVSGITGSIQYNNNGSLGSDSGFTRDPITSSTLIAQNDTSFELGTASMGFINGAAISTSIGNDTVGTTIGQNSLSGDYTASLISLNPVTGNLGRVTSATGSSQLAWTDNGFGEPTIESSVSVADLSVTATFDNSTSTSELKLDGFASSLEFTDQSKANTTKIKIDDNITFEFPSGSYTLPQADGTAGQILSTDGSGQLSWINPAAEPDPT